MRYVNKFNALQTLMNISDLHSPAFGDAENSCFLYSQSTDNQHLCFYQTLSDSTGKEKDSESGFYYFGARYYDCDLSGLFLSVDPMSDKYPSLSPYAYCAWNPVKLVDPDGKDGVCVVNGKSLTVNVIINYSQKEMDKYLKQIDYNYSNAFKNDFAHYYQSANGTYSIDGNDYDVSFNIIFNNIDDIDDFKAEKGSMFLKFDMETSSSSHVNNIITMGNSPRLDEENMDFCGSFSHEVIHGLGVPDTKENKSGKLSSYSPQRAISSDEISNILEPCVLFIKKNNIQNGKVLIPRNIHYPSGINIRNEPIELE